MNRMVLRIIVIFLMVFQIVNAQENIEDHIGYVEAEALDIFEPKDVTEALSVGPLILQEMSQKALKIGKKDDKSLASRQKLSEALATLELVRVQTVAVDSIAGRMDKVARYLDAVGWKRTAKSWRKRERVSVYLQSEADSVVGLFAMVNDRKACTLTMVNVVGGVQVDQMGAVGRALKVEAFGRVARLLPGYQAPAPKLAHNRIRSRKSYIAPVSNIWPNDHEDFLMRYNRVDGPFVGWRLPLKYRQTKGVAHYGEVGYGFGSKKWDYQVGGEAFAFYDSSKTSVVALGFELHGLTDTQDNWRVDELENSLFALLLRRDFRDYYRREGGSAYVSHDYDHLVQVRGQVGVDVFESMSNQVSWNVFGDKWGSRIDFRPNPAIEEGQIRSFKGTIRLDTRGRRRFSQGWFLMAQGEKAGSVLGGDFDFERYVLDVRRYQYIGGDTRLSLRARVGTGRGRIPTQYWFRLGGPSSLRGYGFNAFEGNRMALFNATYWVDGDDHFGGDWPLDDVGIGAFFDAGATWFAEDGYNLLDGAQDLEARVKTSAGFGIKAGDLRIYIARPLDTDDPDWRVWAKFSRAF